MVLVVFMFFIAIIVHTAFFGDRGAAGTAS